MSPSDYLKRPYTRTLTPDETGTYVATIQEFPGCIAAGDTAEGALRNLESAAESWIESALATGYGVPPPRGDNEYSGRIALRLPKSLHRRAAELAEREDTSVNQLLVTAVAHYVGVSSAPFQVYTAQVVGQATIRLHSAIWEQTRPPILDSMTIIETRKVSGSDVMVLPSLPTGMWTRKASTSERGH